MSVIQLFSKNVTAGTAQALSAVLLAARRADHPQLVADMLKWGADAVFSYSSWQDVYIHFLQESDDLTPKDKDAMSKVSDVLSSLDRETSSALALEAGKKIGLNW